jgi:DNA-binding PadR family transcriptional regulator
VSIRGALLALLSEGPKYGLQLRNEFERVTGQVWPLNDGQIYTTLQRLERDGAVASEDDDIHRSRRRVRITESGRNELAEWLSTPPDMSSPPRDDIVMKVLSAPRLPNVSVYDVIQVHHRYLTELMREWTRLKEDEAKSELSFELAVDAVLLNLDALIHWLDEVRARSGPGTDASTDSNGDSNSSGHRLPPATGDSA